MFTKLRLNWARTGALATTVALVLGTTALPAHATETDLGSEGVYGLSAETYLPSDLAYVGGEYVSEANYDGATVSSATDYAAEIVEADIVAPVIGELETTEAASPANAAITPRTTERWRVVWSGDGSSPAVGDTLSVIPDGWELEGDMPNVRWGFGPAAGSNQFSCWLQDLTTASMIVSQQHVGCEISAAIGGWAWGGGTVWPTTTVYVPTADDVFGLTMRGVSQHSNSVTIDSRVYSGTHATWPHGTVFTATVAFGDREYTANSYQNTITFNSIRSVDLVGHLVTTTVSVRTPDGRIGNAIATDLVPGELRIVHDGATARPQLGDTLSLESHGWAIPDGFAIVHAQWTVTGRRLASGLTLTVAEGDLGATVSASASIARQDESGLWGGNVSTWAPAIFIPDPAFPLALQINPLSYVNEPFVQVNSTMFTWHNPPIPWPVGTTFESTWSLGDVVVASGATVQEADVTPGQVADRVFAAQPIPLEFAGQNATVEVTVTLPDGVYQTITQDVWFSGPIALTSNGAPASNPVAGDILRVELDGWQAEGTTRNYRWDFWCPADWTSRSATGSYLTLEAGDLGCELSVNVTFFGDGGWSVLGSARLEFDIPGSNPIQDLQLSTHGWANGTNAGASVGSSLYGGWNTAPWPAGTVFTASFTVAGEEVGFVQTTNRNSISASIPAGLGGRLMTVTTTATTPDQLTGSASHEFMVMGSVRIVRDGGDTPAVGDTLSLEFIDWVVPTGFAPSLNWTLTCRAEDYSVTHQRQLTTLTLTIQENELGCWVSVSGEIIRANWGVMGGVNASIDLSAAPAPAPAPEMIFPDVPASNQFAGAIQWKVDQGITTGFADGTFRPGNHITREAMAAFLFRAAGRPEFTAPDSPTFPDVILGVNTFFHEIEWLSQSGITGGFQDGTFRPGANVNRGAMAAFLFRAANSPEFTAPETPTFVDVPTDFAFFREVEWLASTGITTGWTLPDGTREFRPGSNVTRESTAAFMYRAANQGLLFPTN